MTNNLIESYLEEIKESPYDEELIKRCQKEISNITDKNKKSYYTNCLTNVMLMKINNKNTDKNPSNNKNIYDNKDNSNLLRLKFAREQLQEAEENANFISSNLSKQKEQIKNNSGYIKRINNELDESNRKVKKIESNNCILL